LTRTFFIGISQETIYKHLERKKYSAQLMDGRTISSLISAAESHVTSSFESDPKSSNRRLAQCSMLARIKNDKDVGRSETLPEGKMQNSERLAAFESEIDNNRNKYIGEPDAFFECVSSRRGQILILLPISCYIFSLNETIGCDRLTHNGITNGTSGEFRRRRDAGHPIPKVGDYSVSMLRHPFARALSAFMYKVNMIFDRFYSGQ